MKVHALRLVWLVVLTVVCGPGGFAQQDAAPVKQIWPEVDVYVSLNEKFRLFFLALTTKAQETRDNTEGQVGAHLDYHVNSRITLRAGYRHGFSLGGSDPFKEHKIVLDQTLRQPLPLEVLLSDRNRQELRWVNGNFSVRYRNRVMLEREFKVLNRQISPYGSAEVYYDTRFNTWNRNRLTVGTKIALKHGAPLISLIHPKKQFVLDLYLTRQNDSRTQPSRVRALGVAFRIYY